MYDFEIILEKKRYTIGGDYCRFKFTDESCYIAQEISVMCASNK